MRRWQWISGPGGNSRIADLGILVLRVYFGLALALAHGINKLPPSERFLTGVEGMGFPAPAFFGWASTFAELVCGALVALGFLTRPAAFFILVNMIVATFIRQAGDPFGERELAAGYLAAALAILLIGSGRYALDALIRHRTRVR